MQGTQGRARLGTRSIRVVIADDHAMFRDGVREMLSTAVDMEVVGEAENGEVAVTVNA